jgi:hypothetical protein
MEDKTQVEKKKTEKQPQTSPVNTGNQADTQKPSPVDNGNQAGNKTSYHDHGDGRIDL